MFKLFLMFLNLPRFNLNVFTPVASHPAVITRLWKNIANEFHCEVVVPATYKHSEQKRLRLCR